MPLPVAGAAAMGWWIPKLILRFTAKFCQKLVRLSYLPVDVVVAWKVVRGRFDTRMPGEEAPDWWSPMLLLFAPSARIGLLRRAGFLAGTDWVFSGEPGVLLKRCHHVGSKEKAELKLNDFTQSWCISEIDRTHVLTAAAIGSRWFVKDNEMIGVVFGLWTFGLKRKMSKIFAKVTKSGLPEIDRTHVLTAAAIGSRWCVRAKRKWLQKGKKEKQSTGWLRAMEGDGMWWKKSCARKCGVIAQSSDSLLMMWDVKRAKSLRRKWLLQCACENVAWLHSQMIRGKWCVMWSARNYFGENGFCSVCVKWFPRVRKG